MTSHQPLTIEMIRAYHLNPLLGSLEFESSVRSAAEGLRAEIMQLYLSAKNDLRMDADLNESKDYARYWNRMHAFAYAHDVLIPKWFPVFTELNSQTSHEVRSSKPVSAATESVATSQSCDRDSQTAPTVIRSCSDTTRDSSEQTATHPSYNNCADDECTICAERDCPYKEPFHYHHDGCPACYQDELLNDTNECEITVEQTVAETPSWGKCMQNCVVAQRKLHKESLSQPSTDFGTARFTSVKSERGVLAGELSVSIQTAVKEPDVKHTPGNGPPTQVMPSICPDCNETLLFSYRYGYKKHVCHKSGGSQ